MSLASSGVEASPPLGVLIPKFWARDLDSYSNNFMSFPDDFHSGLAEYLAITPDIPQPIYYPGGTCCQAVGSADRIRILWIITASRESVRTKGNFLGRLSHQRG